MRKSIVFPSVLTLAALMVFLTGGCGFFGSKGGTEVAQVEEGDSPTAPGENTDDGDETASSAEEPQAAQPSRADNEDTQSTNSEQPAKSRPRGPRVASGGLGGSASNSNDTSSSSSAPKKSRPRGPRAASGGLGGSSGGDDGGVEDGGASASADDLGEGDEPEGGPSGEGERSRGGDGENPYAGGYEGGGDEGPPKGEGDDPYSQGGYSGGGEEGPPKGEGDDPYGGAGYSADGEEGPPEGEGDGDDPYAGLEGGGEAPGLGPGGGGAPGPGRRPGSSRPGSNGAAAEKAKPKSQGLMGKAEVAMSEGREKDAFQYLYALALINDQNDLLKQMQWVGGLRRPTMAVRWAIGVDLDVSPRSYKGSLYPIGSKQTLPSRGSRSSGRRGGAEGYGEGGFPGAGGGFPGSPRGGGSSAGGSQPQQLADFAGELGPGVVEILRERVENGSFGKVLADLSEFVNPTSPGNAPAGGNFAGGGRGPAGFGGGGLAGGFDEGGGLEDPGAFGGEGGFEEGAEGGEEDLGAPSLGGQGGGNAAPALGGGGAGPAGGNRGRQPARNNGARGGRRPGSPASSDTPQLAAGVIWLGAANATSLRRKAQQEGVDALLIFHVDTSYSSRTGLVKTSTKATVTDVQKDSVIVRMKSLSNIKVQTEREDGDDLVNAWLDEFAEKIDDPVAGFVVAELPAGLKPEHARGRVERLVAEHSSTSNPLPILTEISFYYSRGLIDDEFRTQAYQQLIGKTDGEQLALGDAKEREAVLQKWLPRD